MDFVSGRAMRPQDIYWKPSSKKRKKSNKGRQRTIWYNKRASGIGKTTKMKMTTTTGTTSHPKNLFGMGGKTGPAVVEEVTTKEGAGPGPGCLRDTDSSGWLKKGAQSGQVVSWSGNDTGLDISGRSPDTMVNGQ